MSKVIPMEFKEPNPQISAGQYKVKVTTVSVNYMIIGGPHDGQTLHREYQMDVPLTIYLREQKHGESR